MRGVSYSYALAICSPRKCIVHSESLRKVLADKRVSLNSLNLLMCFITLFLLDKCLLFKSKVASEYLRECVKATLITS
jgi:hypothetical protein